jgi:hypothetical protein
MSRLDATVDGSLGRVYRAQCPAEARVSRDADANAIIAC